MKITLGEIEAKELVLTPAKLVELWQMLQDHKTLFADAERGNFAIWMEGMKAPGVFWVEVTVGGQVAGLLYFNDLGGFDVTANIVYLDRKPAEKVEITKAVLHYMFDNFAINRITVVSPRIYHATNRLLERLGFKREGCKRQSVLIGKKWVDEFIFGLTRSEI